MFGEVPPSCLAKRELARDQGFLMSGLSGEKVKARLGKKAELILPQFLTHTIRKSSLKAHPFSSLNMAEPPHVPATSSIMPIHLNLDLLPLESHSSVMGRVGV
jgi:hypothetical protein